MSAHNEDLLKFLLRSVWVTTTHKQTRLWPGFDLFLFFKKNKKHAAYFKRIPKYMWNVFLVAWEEKKGEREKERCKEGWNAQRTERVMINFDFKGLIPAWCSLRGWAQTGGEWCVTEVLFFLRAERAADLSEAAAEYILEHKNRKRSSRVPDFQHRRGRIRRTSTNSVIWGTSFGKKCYVRGLGWGGKECLWTRSAVKLWSSSFPQTSVTSVWPDWKKSAFCKESFIFFWLNWWFWSRNNFTHTPSCSPAPRRSIPLRSSSSCLCSSIICL